MEKHNELERDKDHLEKGDKSQELQKVNNL